MTEAEYQAINRPYGTGNSAEKQAAWSANVRLDSRDWFDLPFQWEDFAHLDAPQFIGVLGYNARRVGIFDSRVIVATILETRA